MKSDERRQIAGGGMNILVDNGSYHMDNMGDVAMLQVCVRRIRQRWPEARIQVLGETPERLLAACPGTVPLLPSRWHAVRATPRKLRIRGTYRLERWVQFHLPTLAYFGKRREAGHDPEVSEGIERFYRAVQGVDAAVCSGGGFLTDWHVEHASSVLNTLSLVQAFGKPTAMFGAGIGPLSDCSARALARPVLNRLEVLALREGRGNHRELGSLPVRSDGVVVTGDDAIEPAYAARPDTLGDGIGVNLRLSPAAQAPVERVRELGRALCESARVHGALLVGAPIRNGLSPDNDIDALRRMFAPGSAGVAEAEQVKGPADVIGLVGRCRVVVTGAYHTGVFALSQGIPVVALSGTSYYERKMSGLKEQFGAGVEILRYDEPDLPKRLQTAVRTAWDAAPALREGLLRAAERQIVQSRDAYRTFFEVVEDRMRRHGKPFASSTDGSARR